MVKLQHKTRREGGITVGDPPKHYLLDAEGIVEVSEEHAEMLGRVGLWAPPGTWPEFHAPAQAVPGAGRAPRTRAELEAVAEAEGFPIKPAAPPMPAPSSAPPPRQVTLTDAPASFQTADVGKSVTIGLNAGVMAGHPEPEIETIEVSPDMPLEQLRGVAKQLGLKVPKGITQPKLFELIRSQGESA